MADQLTIDKINTVIKAYFEDNSSITMVRAKDLMPHFIAAGIFRKDEKHGLPIREFLRNLDRAEELRSIPYVYPERIDKNTNWYFIPSASVIPQLIADKVSVPTKKELAIKKRLESDEAYVIDLCDTVLGEKAERQKRFSFLLGDFHKDGITRTQLSVDAYYESLNVVVEYKEAQESEDVDDCDKPQIQTLSGLSRAEQRKIYDERRAEELPKNGITLITIAYSDFNCDSMNKILRNIMSDMEMVKTKLKDFLI